MALDCGFVKATSSTVPKMSALMLIDFIRSDGRFSAPEIRGVKQASAAREEYGDSAVGYIQLKRDGNICTVKGRVCPEHKIREKAYSVTLTVDEEEEVVTSLECHDCAASKGGCKHAIALLMWLHRRTEEPSPTEVECYWLKPRLAQALGDGEMLRASTLGSHTCNSQQLPDASLFLENVIEESRKRNVSSLLLKSVSWEPKNEAEKLGLHYLLTKFSKIFGFVEYDATDFHSFATCNMDQKLCEEAFQLTLPQSECPLWHELRYGRIGASLLREASSCQTEGYLVEKMLGGENAFESKAMTRGRLLEGAVADAASQHFSRSFKKCGIFLNANYPIFAASPDRICDDFIVEIKCPMKQSTVKNYLFEGRIGNKVKMQMQLQMHMLDMKRGLLCVASPSFERDQKFAHHWEEYNGEFIKCAMKKATSFWEKYIFPKFKQVYC